MSQLPDSAGACFDRFDRMLSGEKSAHSWRAMAHKFNATGKSGPGFA